MHGIDEKCVQRFGRLTLKRILEKWVVIVWTGSNWFRLDAVVTMYMGMVMNLAIPFLASRADIFSVKACLMRIILE
jgi:hypothetical protein